MCWHNFENNIAIGSNFSENNSRIIGLYMHNSGIMGH